MRFFPRFALLIAASFLLNTNTDAQAGNLALDAYYSQRDELNAMERRGFGAQAIARQSNPEVLREALEDVLSFSATEEENLDALEQIEIVLGKIPEEGAVYEKVMLYKGKVLRRLGRTEEGDAIFARAFEEQWGQSQYENERSLLELGDYAGMAVHEFERVSGPIQGGSYQVPPYEDGIEDLGRFKTFVAHLKAGDSDVSAMEAVFAEIEELDAPPAMKELAKALCLSEDGRFDEALEIITSVEEETESNDPVWKYIPLYQSMVLMDQESPTLMSQRNFTEARAAFRGFMARCGDDYKLIHSAGIRFTRSMEYTGKSSMMHEVTGLLIDSQIFQDDEIKETFSDYEIAHTYDLHQMGLAWRGMIHEAAEVCRYVYETYSLSNLAAANCAMNYARYLDSVGRDDPAKRDLARNIHYRLLQEARYDALMPWARISLAQISLREGDYESARFHLEDCLHQLEGTQSIELQGLHRLAEMMQQAVERRVGD